MSTPPYDVHALSGAYAVDALDDAERVEFERHLAECAECRAEVASLREAAGLLAETTATEPPPDLRARVLAGIGTVRPLPPESGAHAPAAGGAAPAPPTSLAERRRRRLPRLLAAAAAVVLLGTGAVVASQQPWDHQQQVSAVQLVLEAPDARSTSVDFKDGSSATVTHSDELGKAVIVTHHMAVPPAGKVFQLWYDQPGKGMVSAGLMPERADQRVLLQGDATTATAVGITVEPAGGSSHPTSNPVALFDFGKSA